MKGQIVPSERVVVALVLSGDVRRGDSIAYGRIDGEIVGNKSRGA